MNKLSKILMFSLLGLVLGLSSCNNGGGSGSEPGGDTPGGGDVNSNLRTTYLVLGEGGLYNGEPGESFAHLALDNSVEYVAEVGSDLPNATTVTNSNGQVLHYWYSVDGTGYESVTYTVPQAEYSVLYAKYGSGTASIMRVYFKSPDSWTAANIYVWSSSNNEAMAGWPGTPMAKAESGLWYFDYDVTTYDNVIFNNGSEQTADLKSPTSENADCYVWQNGWYNDDTTEVPGGSGGGGGGDTPSGETMRVYFKSPSSWSQAYIYMWYGAGSAYASWPGTMMNKDDTTGLWYFDYDVTTYDNVIFNNGQGGTGNQTADLKSPTSEDADCYVWEKGWYNDDTTEVPGGDNGGGSTPGDVNPSGNYVYLKPNGNWVCDNAWFAAYFFLGDTYYWGKMTDSNSDGIYETEIPTSLTNVIFVRMDPKGNTCSWDYKWDQTGDLVLPTNGNNLFTINEGQWNNATGTWSTYNG